MKKCPYWIEHSLTAMSEAQSFVELGAIAVGVLLRFPEGAHGSIVQVCGPVSTGGFHSRQRNYLILGDAVRLLREDWRHAFDQTPLEDAVSRLSGEWRGKPGNTGYCWPILEDVYRPLFESRLIGTLFFLPGWEMSAGSCWERSMGIALGLEVLPYPDLLYREILRLHTLVEK